MQNLSTETPATEDAAETRPGAVAPGTLYVVATPIGNLGDVSTRALQVLREVDLIAAEDTRHSGRLLRHFGIPTPLLSYHQHNERARLPRLLGDLKAGKALALIADAGTPLLSDPGFLLVRAARRENLPVSPVPGPSSITAALSVAGLPSDRFTFEGFLPAKAGAREARLQALREHPYTLVFLESSHRVAATLTALVDVFGGRRQVCIARELTKRFEEVHTAELQTLPEWLQAQPERGKGEFVIVVAAADQAEPDRPTAGPTVQSKQVEQVLRCLLAELPLKQAVRLAAELTGGKKNELYQQALRLQG